MAEPKHARAVRCQHHYLYDRLCSQKVCQVYHWLVPATDEPPAERSAELTKITHEKERCDLRPSVL